MVDACSSEPRLAQLYDTLHGARPDFEIYSAIASEVGARSVLDVYFGTGALAGALDERGLVVTGLDPAEASVAIARSKSSANGSGGSSGRPMPSTGRPWIWSR